MSTSQPRENDRIPILGGLHGEVVVCQPMVIRELSRTGAAVETRFPLQIDSLHEVRLTLDDRSVVLKGRVVHARVSDMDQDNVIYRIGLEFVQPSAAVTAALAEYLDTLKSGRSGV